MHSEGIFCVLLVLALFTLICIWWSSELMVDSARISRLNEASYNRNPLEPPQRHSPSLYVHKSTASIKDILNHFQHDRSFRHLNGTAFSSEEVDVIKGALQALTQKSTAACYPQRYPPTQAGGISRYLISSCAKSGAAYIIEFVPEYQDWELHIYTPADVPEVVPVL